MTDYITIRDHNGERRVPMDVRQAQPIRAYPMAEPLELPATTTNQAIVTGSYTDRAAAFNRKTMALATTVAAGSAVVAVVGFSVPILSLAVLGWIMGGFLLTWLCAYIIDAATSPEGAALFGAWRAWRWLDREQDHRHAIEWRRNFPEDYDR